MGEDLKISVAGVRGTYPLALNPETAYSFGRAFGLYSEGRKVFLGRDTRTTGDVLNLAFQAGLLSAGSDVTDLGVAPTPAVAFMVEKNENCCGAVITASHNPAEYNGIKFFSPEGVFLNGEETERLMSIYRGLSHDYTFTPGKSSRISCFDEYFREIAGQIDVERIAGRGFRVVADVCQGTGALFTEEFLSGLGCETFVINGEANGLFSHNPEPLPENIGELASRVVELGADIGFAQDPDADRLAFVCNDGRIPGEETTIVLCIDNILRKRRGSVVVNLSTTSAVEDVAGIYGVDVYRTKIGEVNVVEKMKEVGAVIGGEGNGGVIMPAVHYGRDSFVAMGLILEYMARSDKTVSEILADLPVYEMIKKKITVTPGKKQEFFDRLKERYINRERVILTDGIKIVRDNGWVHIRESGTEPVVRIFVEGRQAGYAERYYSEFSELLL